jgi:type VI secretion system secreted protein VgrG
MSPSNVAGTGSALAGSENAANATFSSKQVGDPVEPCPAKESETDKKKAPPPDPLTKWRADKKDAIEKALASQREMLEAKSKELKTWDGAAKQKFKKAFGKDDDASRDKMSARIDQMLKVNKSMTADNFKPADPSKPGRFAYVYPTDTAHTVYLDEAFDRAPDKGQDSKAGALAHEMSHFNDIGGTKDKFKDVNDDKPIYGATASRKLAADSPDLAINHADSFEYYVEDVP